MTCHFCGKPIAPADLHHHHVVPLADGGEESRQVPCHAACHHQHHRENGDYERWTRATYQERVAMFGPDEVHRMLAAWGRRGYVKATRGNKRDWHRAGGLARVANGRNERGQFVPVQE